jgi:predicted dehydrogenase
MVKVGFIGGGMVSDGHIAGMLSDKRVQIVGVADVDPSARDRVAGLYGVSTFSDYRPMLEKSDVVFICTPNCVHRPLTLEAVAAGKHVICEKPLAMNSTEAEEMVAAADNAGVRLFVAENFRYVPEIIRLRKVILSGEIGRPFLCLSCFIGDEYKRMNDPRNWKCTREKSGGGVVIDNGPHMLDSLYWLFGEVETVSAIGGRLSVDASNKEEDSAQILFNFKNGVMANCSLTFAARHNGFPGGYVGFGVRIDVNATDGSVHTTVGDGILTVHNGERVHLRGPQLGEPRSMNQDFISAILGEDEPLVTGSDGLYVMRMVDACYKSMRDGRSVALDANETAAESECVKVTR